MRKYIFLPLLLLLIQAATQAQNNTIDSLKKILQNEIPDTTRVLSLVKLGVAYINYNPDTALLFSQQGLELSGQINFVKGEAVCLSLAATSFSVTGNYPKALELFLESLKKFESINDKNGIGKALGNAGNVYANLGDYRQSLNYTFRAKSIAEDQHDTAQLTIYILNIGDSYEKLNQVDSALFYTQQANVLSLSLKDIDIEGAALNNLGNIYSKMGQPGIAMEYYNSSIVNYRMENDDEGICESTIGMAKLFQMAGERDSSLYYAKTSLAFAQKGGFTSRVLDASNFITDYYRSDHNIDSAFVYQSAEHYC